jgi:hypothetical protein
VKINISDTVLAEIGKIVVTHSLIEASLANIIGSIVSLRSRHELGQIVTAELSFRQRVGTLRSLITFCLGEDHETVLDFDRIKKLLYSADAQRNLIAHSLWGSPDESDPHTVLRIKTTAKEKRGLRTEFVTLSLEDLHKITDEIGNCYGQLCLFELQFQKGGCDDGASPNAELSYPPNDGPAAAVENQDDPGEGRHQ